MWTFIKSLFASQDAKQIQLSPEFASHVQTAIDILGKKGDVITDEQLIAILRDNGIAEYEAYQIIIFLPTAFTRLLLPAVKWPDFYKEYRGDESPVEKKYAETESFKIIFNVSAGYFQNPPNSEAIMKITARSAELRAINNLLNKNPEAKLELIKPIPNEIHW